MRVNDVSSCHLPKDIQSIFMNKENTLPDALMLPKCESIEHLKQVKC